MTTATTPAPGPTAGDHVISDGAAVPLSRLLRAEIRKTTDTRAGRWLLVAIAAVTALVVVVLLFAGDESELTYDTFASATGALQGYLLPVLGVLAVTSEWSQRTGLVTFTLEPSRSRVVLAKFLAVSLLGLLAVAVAFSLAAVGNVVGMLVQNGDGDWHYQLSWVGETSIAQLVGIIEGFAFGLLLLNSAAAIVAYFVAPLASSIAFSLIGPISGAAPWLDVNTASSPLLDHTMSGRSWLHLAVACLVWLGVPLSLGLWRLRRAEIK